MNVLIIFCGTGDISQVAAGAMLAAFGLAGASAGVHQEERILSVHGHWLHRFSAKILRHVIDEIVAALYHRRRRTVFSGIAAPHEHLVDFLAVALRGFDS